jgi:hypothetical protein
MPKDIQTNEKNLELNDPQFSDEQLIQDQIEAAVAQGPNDSDEEKLVALEKAK